MNHDNPRGRAEYEWLRCAAAVILRTQNVLFPETWVPKAALGQLGPHAGSVRAVVEKVYTPEAKTLSKGFFKESSYCL
jgi:hypothetical protein